MRVAWRAIARRGLSVQTQEKVSDFQQLRRSINGKSEECVELVKEWVEQGNDLTHDNCEEIYQSLVDRKLSKEALKVMEYTKLKGMLKPSPENTATQLKLTSREFGSRATETSFTRLPAAMKTEKVIATYLTCLLKQRAAFKALMYMHGLDSPQTSDLCAAMLSVYWSLNMHEKMMSLYTRCKEQKIHLTIPAYLLMLRYKKRMGGDGLEKIEDCAKEALETCDDHLHTPGLVMEVHAHLGDVDRVDQLWSKLDGTRPDNFVSALTAFELVGDVQKAEKVFKEFAEVQQRSNCNPYFKMIDVYAKRGMMYEAELVLDQYVNAEDRCFFPYNSLIEGYLSKGDIEKALQNLQKGYAERTVCPSYGVVMKLLPLYAEEKDLVGANRLLHFYMNRYRGDILLYNNMLRVLIATKHKPGELLKKFKVEPNDETKQLVRRVNWAGDHQARKLVLENINLWG